MLEMFRNLSHGQKILIGFLLLFLICLGVGICYKKKILSEYFSSGKKTLIMFHAKWCPHCQNALPGFKQFQQSNQSSKDIIIEVEEGEKQGNEYWQQYKNEINGFPTIILVKESGEIEHYKGARTANGYRDFMNKS